MMDFEITSGPRLRAQKVLVYGQHGIGKTTLASKWPDPVFIDTEGGTDGYDVRRLPRPMDWATLMNEVAWAQTNLVGGTIVLDSADWAERLCTAYVCAKKEWESVESPGYGKGYVAVRDEFSNLLRYLDGCIAMGVNVVLVAHEQITTVTMPGDAAGYSVFGLKLSKHVTPLVKEWADAVLYCHYKQTVLATDKEGRHGRALGGTERVIQTEHTATIDAKNRWGLPAEIPMDFAAIAPHIPGADEE